MLLRIVRDGGRGVLWSWVSWASCATSAALGVLSFFSSGVTLFVRLCLLLPTRLIRRMPPMNRRLPFSSPLSGGTPGIEGPCASLDRSFDEARIETVELFFAGMKTLLNHAEYKTLVDETHRRFHPDKWRARGVLACASLSDRSVLEAAGNRVAQAVTPLRMVYRDR